MMTLFRVGNRILRYVWASPYTLIGLAIGAIGLLTGGSVRRRGPVLEFYGGFVRWLIQRLPTGELTLAMTLGHVLLGQTSASLDVAYRHELVHVRQFERWGPMMGFLYLGSSLLLWLQRRDPYLDNPFEREAYESDRRDRGGPSADEETDEVT